MAGDGSRMRGFLPFVGGTVGPCGIHNVSDGEAGAQAPPFERRDGDGLAGSI